MIAALMKRLGLDRIDEFIAEEVRKVQIQVLQEERTAILGHIAKLDERIRDLGGKRRPGRPRSASPVVVRPEGKASARRKPGRPPGGSVKKLAIKAMADGASIRMPELLQRVIKVGYRGGASPRNLRTMLVKVLRNRSLFRRVRRGVYRLRRERAVEGRAGK